VCSPSEEEKRNGECVCVGATLVVALLGNENGKCGLVKRNKIPVRNKNREIRMGK
jgi:hypothetical protein